MLALRLALLFSALLSAGPGCGFLSRRDPAPAGSGLHREVLVEVENHNWNDITIYLMAGGLPHRLGMVTALSNASFAFPSQRLHTLSGVRLRALPVAGRSFTSESIWCSRARRSRGPWRTTWTPPASRCTDHPPRIRSSNLADSGR